MRIWGRFALLCAVAAGMTAVGALAFWAVGDPPDTGRTLSVIMGLICAALVSGRLGRRR